MFYTLLLSKKVKRIFNHLQAIFTRRAKIKDINMEIPNSGSPTVLDAQIFWSSLSNEFSIHFSAGPVKISILLI